MNTVYIEHNPFIVDTKFLINGKVPSDASPLARLKGSRIQEWVENIFHELSSLFNGDNDFHVNFKGVESDYLDVLKTAEQARSEGMKIKLKWEKSSPTEQRLEKVKKLIDAAKEKDRFSDFINKNDAIKKSLDDAFDRDFEVCVVATMSSGKSTLINAMLGDDLLPAANEATTATIFKIMDKKVPEKGFSAKCYNHDGVLIDSSDVVSLPKLQDWNAQSETRLIAIEGNILAITDRLDVRLILTDTPGPNNSRNEEHQRATMKYIQDSYSNPLILYVLNAQSLGVNDDSNLLRLVSEAMKASGMQSRDRFIFVVNKMDVFDPEIENISSVLDRVREYLNHHGIVNPLICPVSANLTRLIRKPSDQHTRKERSNYKEMADIFTEDASMNLLQYMPVTSRVKRLLDAKKMTPLMLSSGLPAVEVMIDEYIDKYNLPHRLKRAYDAVNKAIEAGLNSAELDVEIENNQHEIESIKKEIENLEKRHAKSLETASYKKKLEQSGIVLPAEIVSSLNKLQIKGDDFIRNMGGQFRSADASKEEAQQKLEWAAKEIQGRRLELINSYERIFIEAQDLIRDNLKIEYEKHIAEIFEDVADLKLPILEGIKKSTTDIPFNVSLDAEDVRQKKVISGTHEVSTSKWYNPFSWGSTVTVNDYKTINYVDLNEVWRQRVHEIEVAFRQLLGAAKEELSSTKEKLLNEYLKFVAVEFDAKFVELIQSLKNKIGSREDCEKAVKEAKELQVWINKFKLDLDSTLQV